MAQPYTIRLDPAQVDALTHSGTTTLRDGITQLLAAATPPPAAGEPTHPPPASGDISGRKITITVTID